MAAKKGLGKGLGAIFGEEVIKEQKERLPERMEREKN